MSGKTGKLAKDRWAEGWRWGLVERRRSRGERGKRMVVGASVQEEQGRMGWATVKVGRPADPLRDKTPARPNQPDQTRPSSHQPSSHSVSL